jgi:tetratricopeptide (TPR) repeat protein
MRKVLYSLFAGVLVLSGCTLPKMVQMAKQQNLTVTPNPLEVHKDTVAYDMAANLPVKMLKKGTVYTLNSFYKFGDNELALNPIPFDAKDYPNSGTEQPRVTKNFTFPYNNPALKSGVLEVQGVASKSGKSKTTERMPVATGLITTSKLVKPVYYAAFAGHGYDNSEEIIPVIIPDFIFEQGKSVLRKSEINSEKGKQLDAFIASKNVTRTVTITGTHSPEGAERINTKLANERAAVIEKYYRDQMKKYDYQDLAKDIKFIQKPVVDDWTEFKTSLAAFEGISSEQKSEYLNIINAGGTFEDQEKKMHKLSTYKKVFKDVYPGLRTAQTEILTIKDKKTDEEISVLAKQITGGQASADALSFEEMMYAATLTPSLNEKAAIYEAATKKGSNWNAHNNLAATYIAMATENPDKMSENVTKASAQLDIAARLRETAEVHANMASVDMMKGNAYSAYNHAAKALNMGANNDVSRGVNGVKGASEIFMARYADAVRSESSAADNVQNLFNKGLAQLLNKDYSNASASFSEAIRKDGNFALAHYGAAVAAARSGNQDGVISNLTNAVRVDPALKQAALTDLEFAKWAANDAFRNALK